MSPNRFHYLQVRDVSKYTLISNADEDHMKEKTETKYDLTPLPLILLGFIAELFLLISTPHNHRSNSNFGSGTRLLIRNSMKVLIVKKRDNQKENTN